MITWLMCLSSLLRCEVVQIPPGAVLSYRNARVIDDDDSLRRRRVTQNTSSSQQGPNTMKVERDLPNGMMNMPTRIWQ
jgi:hypothetical protein